MQKSRITLPFLFSLLLVLGFSVGSQKAYADTTATLLPVSDGNYLQWTPSTGTSHFALVNEASCNGNTNYNSTNTVNNRDSYGVNLSSVPNGATITQIALTPCASKNSSGGSNSVLNLFYRLNGGDSAVAGAYSLGGTTPAVLSTTNFSLSTVKSSTTTLEFGAVHTSGNKGLRLSQLSGVITYTPLASPSGLVAASLSTESAKLTWTDNATNETGYKIERSTDSANFTQIASVAANTVSYIDKNVIGTYYYRVRATNSGGDSAYSNTASTTVTLNAPTSLTATDTGTESSKLIWVDNSSNETGYKIERGTDGVNFTQVASVGANLTSYTDRNVVGSFYYRVRAYKTGATDSGYSNVANVTVALKAPTSLSATPSTGSAQLTWTDNSNNETGFTIERGTDGVSFTPVGTSSANVPHYTDPGLASGTYYYRVKATTSTVDSVYSNTASVTIL